MAHEVYGQHAIPQEISSYQFRLVGDMTLKQFFQIAAGALVGIILYSSNMAAFVKWPLIAISVLVGVALAFFKLEDRPLEIWIISFFKSIYSPTIFSWQTPTKPYQYFKEEQHQALPVSPNQNQPNLMQQQNVSFASPQTIQEQADQKVIENVEKQTGVATDSAPLGLEKTETKAALIGLEEGEQEFMTQLSEHFDEVEANYKAPQTNSSTPTAIPQSEAVQVAPQKQPLPQAVTDEGELESITSTVTDTHTQAPMASSMQATHSETAAPSLPTRENIIVGQVTSEDGKIVEGAILEIKDETGRPVRALKTNQLGHFGIVTPLFPGMYTISTEKLGYLFDPVSITLQNEIVDPIAITGRIDNNSN